MNKCIQFVLSAMIALGLPLVAQTNAQLQVNTASPVLQAFNHDPEFVSEAGGVEPDVNQTAGRVSRCPLQGHPHYFTTP